MNKGGTASRQCHRRVGLIFIIAGCLIGGVTALVWLFIQQDGRTLKTCIGPNCQKGISNNSNNALTIQKASILNNPFVEVSRSICDCSEEPPRLPHSMISQWNGASYQVGDSVTYICSMSPKKEISAVAECTEDCAWEIVFLQQCQQPTPTCEVEPPHLPPPFHLQWNHESREMGTILYYTCSSDKEAPAVQMIKCTESGQWEFLFSGTPQELAKKHCECSEEPPSPPPPLALQEGSRAFGSIRNYSCVEDPQSPVVQTVVCQKNLQWVFGDTRSWSEIIKTQCECYDTPLGLRESSSDWDGNSRHIGTQINVFCPEGAESEIFMNLQCTVRKTWNVSYYNPCECHDDPPPSTFPHHREWNGQTKLINTRIQYFCFDDPDSPVYQEIACNSSRLWETKFLSTCECADPPPKAQGSTYTDWDGKSTHIGTVVYHYCSTKSSQWKLKYKCTFNKTWEVTQRKSCDCIEEPPSVQYPFTREWISYLNSAVYRCSNDSDAPVIQTAICNTDGKWDFLPPKPLENLSAIFCDCAYDPPSAELPAVSDWNERSRHVSTVVTHYCLNDTKSGVKVRYRCSPVRVWEEIERNSCDCAYDPPSAELPAVSDWNERSRHVSTVVTHYCLNDTKSGVKVRYRCSPVRVWEEIERNSCDCAYDPPSAELPAVSDWNERSRHVSTVVAHYCLNDTKSGVKVRYRCSPVRVWEEIERNSCDCVYDPPSAELPAVSDWNERRRHVSTVVTHYCLNDTKSGVKVRYRCSPVRVWEEIERNSCDCAYDPPAAELPAVSDWNERRRHVSTVVTHYCLNDTKSGVKVRYRCSPVRVWEEIERNSCDCTHDPPSAELPAVSDWNERNRHVNTVVTHYCLNDTKSGVKVRYRCSPVRGWEEIERNSCDCVYDPPSAELPAVSDWNERSRHVSTVVTHYCLNDTKSGVKVRYRCSPVRVWEEVERNSCDCAYDPPSAELPAVSDWNERSRHVSTVVTHYCLNDTKSGVKVRYRCSPVRVWEEIERNSCECNEAPPVAEAYLVRLWANSSSYVNSTVVYACSINANATIVQTAICSYDKYWKLLIQNISMTLLAKQNCECMSDPPQPNFPGSFNWRGGLRLIGTEVIYFCLENPEAGVKLRMKCSPNKIWEIVSISSCECQGPPPIPPPPLVMEWMNSSYVNSAVNYRCSSKEDSTVIQTAVCAYDKQWKFTSALDLETLKSKLCECYHDPPRMVSPGLDDWDGISRDVGTIVTHYCLEDKSVGWSKVVTCNANQQWEIMAEGSCECPSSPPVPPPPLVREWNLSRYINARVTYRCSSSSDAVSVQSGVCTYQRTWELQRPEEFSRLIDTICICQDNPPSPLLSLSWNWDGMTRRMGTRVSYMCSGYNVTSLVIQAAVCFSNGSWGFVINRPWNVLVTENCECPPPPPPPSRDIVLRWIGPAKRIGSTAVYWCRQGKMKTLHLKLFCADSKTWEIQGSQVTCTSAQKRSPEIVEPLSLSEQPKGSSTASAGDLCPPKWNGTCSPASMRMSPTLPSSTHTKGPRWRDKIASLPLGSSPSSTSTKEAEIETDHPTHTPNTRAVTKRKFSYKTEIPITTLKRKENNDTRLNGELELKNSPEELSTEASKNTLSTFFLQRSNKKNTRLRNAIGVSSRKKTTTVKSSRGDLYYEYIRENQNIRNRLETSSHKNIDDKKLSSSHTEMSVRLQLKDRHLAPSIRSGGRRSTEVQTLRFNFWKNGGIAEWKTVTRSNDVTLFVSSAKTNGSNDSKGVASSARDKQLAEERVKESDAVDKLSRQPEAIQSSGGQLTVDRLSLVFSLLAGITVALRQSM